MSDKEKTEKKSSKKSTKFKTGHTRTGDKSQRSKKPVEILETPECLRNEGFETHELLGEGAYSKVYRATSPKTPGQNYAVKRYKIQPSTQKWIDRCLLREMRIACLVRHPSIVEAYAGIKSETDAFLVIQYAPCGSIASYLKKLPSQEYVKERKIKTWAFDLFNAVAYLHNTEICHRDIKCDNFLLDEQKKPLIADFSFACLAEQPDVRFDCMVNTVCGTSVYLAPEVHTLKRGQKYEAKAVDVFALGVSLYEMFTKTLPYKGRYKIRDPELIQKMEEKAFKFLKSIPISEEAKNLINDMLDPLPRTRPSINNILVYKWFDAPASTGKTNKTARPGTTTKSTSEFRNFITKRDLDRLRKLNSKDIDQGE